MKSLSIILASIFFLLNFSFGQSPTVSDPYLKIRARATDPLYTTYAAAIERSRLYGDKAYKMDYYSGNTPIKYSSDQAGSIYTIWMVNKVALMSMNQFYKKPVVVASFPDMAMHEYMPTPGVKVEETFLVYSSTVAVVQMNIQNCSDHDQLIDLYPVMEMGQGKIEIVGYENEKNAYLSHHFESKDRLISSLYADAPYPEYLRDIFAMDSSPKSKGGYKGSMEDFYNTIKTDWYDENRVDSLNGAYKGEVDFLSFHQRFKLQPGEEKQIRYYRGMQDQKEPPIEIMNQLSSLKQSSLQPFVDANESLFKSIPRIHFKAGQDKLLFFSAFNLVRSSMLPPSGKTKYNFYVFSRNPKWGWGHGHQVLHESLSMMSYVYLDPESAQNSQRIFMEQQGEDGLIAYRHGPRGAQTYPHKGEPTTSAPFFSWINWDIYEVSKDMSFLRDAYSSGSGYLEWLIQNRDKDKDGLYEWGPYGIIENVRDWYNVVFQVSKERYLDVDKEDISDELECLDLSLMMVKEMKSLSKMALELGRNSEAQKWQEGADQLGALINDTMWDEESGFYYHVDMKDHRFQFMDRDLKRMEIIGFLPLWAEVAPIERADKLVKHLTDTTKFWRKNGVPTLSADDPYYNPNVDYCCKWNGPVWLLWDYMVFDGLMNYGYIEEARVLGEKMLFAVQTQLSRNHNFWESYSPDYDVLNCPPNYIWDAIMAKLIIRLHED